MGRQMAIAATQADEQLFLEFLRSTAEIRIFQFFAPSPEELWVESFATEFTGNFMYFIWNSAFPWTPQYGQSHPRPYGEEGTQPGQYFIANEGSAPIIEFSRSDIQRRHFGRIYWSKYFSAPNGLDYDVDAFSKWYDSIVRWIRRNTAGKTRAGWVTHFLPDAWKVYTALEQATDDSQ